LISKTEQMPKDALELVPVEKAELKSINMFPFAPEQKNRL